jgi:hypothetical protein
MTIVFDGKDEICTSQSSINALYKVGVGQNFGQSLKIRSKYAIRLQFIYSPEFNSSVRFMVKKFAGATNEIVVFGCPQRHQIQKKLLA